MAEERKKFENDDIESLFESSEDGRPLESWTMENVNSLLEKINRSMDYERASDEFELDRYQNDYDMLPKPKISKDAVGREKSDDSKDSAPKDIFISKRKKNEPEPEEREVFSGKKKEKFVLNIDYSEEENMINDEPPRREPEPEPAPETENSSEEEISSFVPEDDPYYEKSYSEEFRELNEEEIEDFQEPEDEEFDRGDYMRIKDIFKNSKILSRRREQRARAKSDAMENVKKKFGRDIFSSEKKDYDEFVEIPEEENSRDEQTKFDIQIGEHIAVETEKEETVSDRTKVIENINEVSEIKSVEKEDAGMLDQEAEEKKEPTKKIDLGEVNNFEEKQNDDGQMRLEGYTEDENMADQVSEEEIDDALSRKSDEKKKAFRLTSIPEDYNDIDSSYYSAEKGKYDDEEHIELSDENDRRKMSEIIKDIVNNKKEKTLSEYRTPNEIPQVFKELKDKRKKYILSSAALAVLEIFALVILGLPIANQFTSSVTAASAVNVVISIIILLMAFCVCAHSVQNGFRGLFTGKINSDTFISVAFFSCLAGNIASFFALTDVNVTVPIYSPFIIFAMMVYNIAGWIRCSAVIGNFKCITKSGREELYATKKVDNRDDADVMARIFAGPNPNVGYSVRTGFPGRFLFNSFANHPVDKFSRRMFYVGMILSFIVSLIAALANGSVVFFFTVFSGAMCTVVPVSLIFSTDIPMRAVNRKLNKSGSCITGQNAVTEAEKMNAVIINATDLFDTDKCNFHGMQEYGTIRVDDIVLYAAAMLTQSRGPLAHVFDKVIIGDSKDMLPKVEDLFYEERLGLSGWIQGQKVLVGNRNLLINHNLEAPPKSEEMNAAREGKRVLYVAVDSRVAAMLVVSYAPNENMKEYLSKLEKSGITIIVSTNDCNVDEEVLALRFEIPRESFKVVGDYEGGLLSKYTNVYSKSVPAKLIHNSSAESFLQCLSNAISLSSAQKLVKLLHMACTFIVLLIVLITSCMGNPAAMGWGAMILYHLISSVLLSITVLIRNKL